MAELDTKMPAEFPYGLRVLLVDDDRLVLRSLEQMLLKCGYKVTVADHAFKALKILRANKGDFDIVITDINMPDMDGFKFLETVGLEMDLPVIMLSVDCDVKSVMKGLMHGAVDYLVKPARLEELMLIWKHVAKKSLNGKPALNNSNKKLNSGVKSENQNPQLPRKSKERRTKRDDDDDAESDEDSASQKRPRVIWTKELHAKFIGAVRFLGIDRAVPKKILDIMDSPGLSRENVASHLQKYRKGLKRNAMGLRGQLIDSFGTSGHVGSSIQMGINKQVPILCSFERSNANVYKNMTMSSSPYLPYQQSRNFHSFGPSSLFPRPMQNQNDFHRQYVTNSHGSQLSTLSPGCAKNPYMMKVPNQLLDYQSITPSTNQLHFCAPNSRNSCPSEGIACLDSVQPLQQQPTEIFLSNNLSDNNFSEELDAILAFDQEQQQFSSCSGADVEKREKFHRVSFDFQSNNHDDCTRSNSLNLADYTDDLHVALKQDM